MIKRLLMLMGAIILLLPLTAVQASASSVHLKGGANAEPVFTDTGEVDFYLPELGDGVWTDLLSGEKRAGGRWVRETHGFLSLPLYVAPGTVLPWGAETERPDYDYARGLTLRVVRG